MTRCTFCDHKNPTDATNCESCGAQLPESFAANQEAMRPASLRGDVEQRVAALLRERKKIEAIKIYREATGVGLKEAKDAVEGIARDLGIETGGAGCAAVLAFLLLTILGFLWTII